MRLTPTETILFLTNAAYIVPAAIYFYAIGNYEFLLYVAQVVILLGIVALTIHKSKFPIGILLGLSLWSVLHMAGGGVPVDDSVLYAMEIWRVAEVGDTYIFKYDQLVHAFGFFMSTLVLFHLLMRTGIPSARIRTAAWIAAFGGMGLGAINEIIEFIPVLLLPQTGVGGYYNTALDLVANGIGAVVAALLIIVSRGSSKAAPQK
jgi:uncharacterized membrane protein YjdF